MDCIRTIDGTVHDTLSFSRYAHCVSVSEFSQVLCRRYAPGFAAESESIVLASLFHDYCREWKNEDLKAYAVEHELSCEREEMVYPVLLHAPVAAHIASRTECLDSKPVIDAIRWHTLGNSQMGLLGALVFCADYMEPGRCYMNESIINTLMENETIEGLVKNILDHHISHMSKKGRPVADATLRLYDYIKGGGTFR